jgi:hypothetical protein
MVHNEPVFFPIWHRYYSRFFAPEDMYVLDHETDDGSIPDGVVTRIPVFREGFDNVWQVEAVQALQEELLQRYDIVVAVDVDELIAPRPNTGDLGTYLDTFDEEFVTCLGYEIVHLPDREPRFDSDVPVLEQRHYWAAHAAYNKSSIATCPSRWGPGFHRREDGHARYDPDLFLIHLHRLDYFLCLSRHEQWSRRQWSRNDIVGGWGHQNRISGGPDFDHWFFNETGFEGFPLPLEEIPAEWRGVF